jgi:putative peptidoglycan lipid II flippase
VAGAGLQLAVQVPVVWRLMSGHWTRVAADIAGPVRRVLVSTLPVIFTRGVVQVSGYIDNYIATWLGAGAVAGLTNAQQLSLLPVSLFGMAVSSAALPSMSTAVAANLPEALRTRLSIGQETIAALVVPSVVAFLALGDVMIAMLLEHGQFSHGNTLYVWGILAGSSIGLLATTVGRLYVSTFYALGDTTTPTRIAVFRVLLVGGLGYLLALPVPRLIGLPLEWGCAGLTVSAGLSGWIEFLLLRRFLRRRIGDIGGAGRVIGRAWIAAAIAAALATGARWLVPPHLLVVRGLVILGVFGSAYLLGAQWLGILDARTLLRRLMRRKG